MGWGLLGAAFASHFMGGTMYYECLNACLYRVYFSAYVDCAGTAAAGYVQPVTPANPYPFSGTNVMSLPTGCLSTGPLTWIHANTLEISPVCPSIITKCSSSAGTIDGLFESTYYADFNICGTGCNQMIFSWWNCCRSYVMTSGAGGNEIFTSMTIDFTSNNCNSSPRFDHLPIAYIPAGVSSAYSQAAIDPDGDSLVYSLVNCWRTNTTSVAYNPGYSPTSPLGPTWNVNIDPQTGLLSFVPAVGGGAIASGVICIQVDEYRNGQLLGSITRDNPITVLNVPIPNAGPTTAISNLVGGWLVGNNPTPEIQVTPNTPLSFDITASLPNGNPISYKLGSWFSANLNVSATPSGSNPLNLHFSWIPTAADTGSYSAVFDFYDSTSCPLIIHTYRTVFVKVVNLPPFGVSPTLTPTACNAATGMIDLSLSGGQAPFSFSWSNGATTQNLQNLAVGAYSVLITDANNVQYHSPPFYINSININVNMSAFPPTCQAADGAMSLQISGGSLPYNILWNTGSTADSIFGLTVGGYSVDVTDANGCFFHGVKLLNYDPADTCEAIITGIVFNDLNGNCIQDAGEVGTPNFYVDLTMGPSMLTDANGSYTFKVPIVGNFQVQLYPHPYTQATSPCNPTHIQTAQIGTLDTTCTLDFPVEYQPDYSVSAHGYYFSPSLTEWRNCIGVYNISSYVNQVTVEYYYDAGLKVTNFPFPYPLPVSHDTITRKIVWQLNNVYVGYTKQVRVYFEKTPSSPLGDTVYNYVQIFPGGWDVNPNNNFDTLVCVVGAPYDPNQKTAYPTGQTIHGLIPPATPQINYTVDFQNTGNWPATFVIIRDTLDDDFDITSFQFMSSSHPCTVSFEDDKVAVFTFANINLPDSSSDYLGSMGYVKYALSPKPQLPLDTRFDNSAAIYFDFNPPIITNTTRHTLYKPMELSGNWLGCKGYPLAFQVAYGKPPYQLNWAGGSQTSPNGQFTVPTNAPAGIHNLQVTDAYGMVKTQPITLVEGVSAAFSFQSGGPNFIFIPALNNLASYSWNFGDGGGSPQSSPVHTFAPGTYTVSLTATDACGNTATASQQITVTSAIGNADFQVQVSVSPNPGSGLLRLSFPNPGGSPYGFTLSDMAGRVVLRLADIRQGAAELATGSLPSGNYVWELQGKHIAVGLWVKE